MARIFLMGARFETPETAVSTARQRGLSAYADTPRASGYAPHRTVQTTRRDGRIRPPNRFYNVHTPALNVPMHVSSPFSGGHSR